MSFHDNKKPILLVEGYTDLYFVKHIYKKSCLSFDWEVKNGGGIDSVLSHLEIALRHRERPPIGVIVDADSDIKKCWSRITSRLKVSTPEYPSPGGTIIDQVGGLPRIGIWVMPDNESSGELEDFVIEMIPDDDVVWCLSKAYVDGIPEDNRKFNSGKIDRAKLYAWLAVRKQPSHIGTAICDGDLDISTERCKAFVAWLKRLYGDGVS